MHHETQLHSQRGVTLIEVLIVVAILSLIAAGIAVAAYQQYEEAKKTHTRTMVRTLRRAVQGYRTLKGVAICPSFLELVEVGAVDEDSPVADPWGSPWEVECSGARVVVRSLGPDTTSETEDDIVAPARAAKAE